MNMKSTKKKTAKAKPPTFAEMQAVVRAWLAANHPEVEHATLSSHNRYGSGPELAEIIGPPEDKAWFTNDLPPTAEQEAEREKSVNESVKKYRKDEEKRQAILQQADELDPSRKIDRWLARWSNAVAVLNSLDNAFQELEAIANDLPFHGDSTRLNIDHIIRIASAVNQVSADSLTPPTRGDMRMLAAKGGA
jgi:hypothetical protein